MERVTGIEPAFPDWKSGTLAIVLHPHGYCVGPAGIEPACAGLQPAANPSQLETRGAGAGRVTRPGASELRRRNGQARTGVLLAPNQARGRLRYVPVLLVGLARFELTTSCPPDRRAGPSCATARLRCSHDSPVAVCLAPGPGIALTLPVRTSVNRRQSCRAAAPDPGRGMTHHSRDPGS